MEFARSQFSMSLVYREQESNPDIPRSMRKHAPTLLSFYITTIKYLQWMESKNLALASCTAQHIIKSADTNIWSNKKNI